MKVFEVLILLLLFCGTLPILLHKVKAIYATAVLVVAILALIFIHTQINIENFTSFVFGNFSPSIGIEHKPDTISYFLVTIIAFCGMYTSYSLLRRIESVYTKYIACFVTIAIASSLIISITKDIFNFYVFFELCNICFYLIFANTADVQRKKYILEYVLLSGIASVFLVLAIEIIYVTFGTLNVVTLKSIAMTGNHLILMKIATLFMVITVFIKLGIFPFNVWVKKIYTTCPNFFLPFYATIAPSLMLYLVIFFEYYVIKSYDIILFTSKIVTPFCLATILIFSFLAIKEKDLRTIFAYSTLVQVSYALICLTTPNVSAINGGILHIVHNAICKFGLFVIICQLYISHKSYNISILHGLFSNKTIALCFCILCASLIGFPLTSGFVSKFYMFQGLIEEKRFISLGVFVIGAVFSIVYFWRIIQPIFFEKAHNSVKIDTMNQVTVVIITMASIVFGIFTKITLAKSQTIVTMFLQNLS